MITVQNRQRQIAVDSQALQAFAARSLAKILTLVGPKRNRLKTRTEVVVIFVSDKRIAEIHRRFLNQRGPTDVITFQHGEIFISAETAKRQAREFRTALDHELRLYIVHGLLHLRGFDDKTAPGAAEMKRLQEKLVASL